MTNEEAKKLSVLKITNLDTLDTVGRPLPGGLDDPGVYTISGSDQCLIGTAEIPVGGLHMDSILSESSLPLKYVAYSHCFRTEAGAAGAATRGLYRVHQFIAHQFITTGRLRLSDLPSYSVVLRCYISMER